MDRPVSLWIGVETTRQKLEHHAVETALHDAKLGCGRLPYGDTFGLVRGWLLLFPVSSRSGTRCCRDRSVERGLAGGLDVFQLVVVSHAVSETGVIIAIRSTHRR